jgi:hypothetical protein
MMSSAMLMERTSTTFPGMGMPSFGSPAVTSPAGVSGAANWMMVPRCTFKVEKCTGGFKVTCTCDDKLACSMVQNLCAMLAGGMCSCCVMYNGMTVCTYNLTMGMCRFENTDSGVCFTCTSGDAQCCAMIQSCCDCLGSMLEAGCTCCFMVNSTPVCCGASESGKHGMRPAVKK